MNARRFELEIDLDAIASFGELASALESVAQALKQREAREARPAEGEHDRIFDAGGHQAGYWVITRNEKAG